LIVEPGLIVVGALGRMGRALQEAALSAGLPVEGLVDRPDMSGTPSPVEGVRVSVSGSLRDVADAHRVAILFSSPDNTLEILRSASSLGMALVVGTTGMGEAGDAAILEASSHVPVVAAANYSVGVNLLLELVETAARTLGSAEYDAEIVEAHHKHKKDAPSGTALMLARSLAKGRGVELSDVSVFGRVGLPGPRPVGEIGIHAVRGGSVVGDHWVTFFGEGERIEFHHHAENRQTFAQGAVRAARWVAGQKPGLYTMRHVLGLD